MAVDTPISPPSRAWLWPVGLIALMCGSIGVCVVTAVVAAGDPTFGLEPDYYEKAVAWDATAAAREASARLGWTASAEVSIPDGPLRERTLTVHVSDADGVPVFADRIEVVAFHHARSREHIQLSIGAGGTAPAVGLGAVQQAAPGSWSWSLGSARAGVWQVRVKAARGGDEFSAVLDVETPDGGR